jgi:hypothetical protein
MPGGAMAGETNSTARVMLCMQILEALARHVSIYLRG